MAYYTSFSQVATLLQQMRARLVRQTARGDVYVTPANKWVKVARAGTGFDVTVHASRESCGCG